MLAVVFWNSRRRKISKAEYIEALVDFHRSLNRHKPTGFRFSATYRVNSIPWFEPKREVFEDWYVLSNFAAMDALDNAVLDGPTNQQHRMLMRGAATASGAIFYLTKGAARMNDQLFVNWITKPRDVTADDFFDSIKKQLPNGKCSFWTRAMALGAKEHCLLTSGAVKIPEKFEANAVKRELIWQP